mmetsp:Transcript_89721/g.243340  ORF Transcript_89721/g.243340 Transcript_89721/m.243340 type:complete len:447 (-) Transcript_89721:56-1396(-)
MRLVTTQRNGPHRLSPRLLGLAARQSFPGHPHGGPAIGRLRHQRLRSLLQVVGLERNRPALEGGLLYRGQVSVGAEHATHPRVAQAAHAPHVDVQGLVRRLRDCEHRWVDLSAHGELQALGLNVLTKLLPPHEVDLDLADGSDLLMRIIEREGHPGRIVHLQGEIRHHLLRRPVGTAHVARVGANPHNLMVEPRAGERNLLHEQPARLHTIGIQVPTELEPGRLTFVERRTEQDVLGGLPNIVAFAAQGAHVGVVVHRRVVCRRGCRRRACKQCEHCAVCVRELCWIRHGHQDSQEARVGKACAADGLRISITLEGEAVAHRGLCHYRHLNPQRRRPCAGGILQQKGQRSPARPGRVLNILVGMLVQAPIRLFSWCRLYVVRVVGFFEQRLNKPRVQHISHAIVARLTFPGRQLRGSQVEDACKDAVCTSRAHCLGNGCEAVSKRC